MNKHPFLWPFLALLLSIPLWAHATEQALPELGDSAALALTPQQEREIGAEMVRRMRRNGLLIDDPLVSAYIEGVGRTLSLYSDNPGQAFRFFVVDAPSINAFALPGGYIGVHSGLILASRNESELASVLAHEIAHVTQRHLARGFEKAQRMQWPMTVAVIAAILLGGGDPQVVNAAVAASVGGAQQMQLNFTRAHEHEADRIGMQLLAHSDYDPAGMAGFFSRLQEESRYYGEGVPEFLRTHPVTTSRLAEAEQRASHYPQKLHRDSVGYRLARARMQLHHSKSPQTLLRELEQEKSTESDYLRAITLLRLQQPQEAARILQNLLDAAPNNIAYRHTLIALHQQQGNDSQALKLGREGLKRYPRHALLGLDTARSLLTLGQHDKAAALLQTLMQEPHPRAESYQLLAEVEAARGRQAKSYIAQAEYYRRLDDPHSALEQLKSAQRMKQLDIYLSSRIDAMSLAIKEQIRQQQMVLQP